MATFTLSDLKKTIDTKYAPTVVENGADTFVLPNFLQMPKATRDKVAELMSKSEEDADAEDKLQASLDNYCKAIEVAEESGRGAELVELLGGNAAMIVELVSTWSEGSELGEA